MIYITHYLEKENNYKTKQNIILTRFIKRMRNREPCSRYKVSHISIYNMYANYQSPEIPRKFQHAYVHVYTCTTHKSFRSNIIAPSDHCFENGMVFDSLFPQGTVPIILLLYTHWVVYHRLMINIITFRSVLLPLEWDIHK